MCKSKCRGCGTRVLCPQLQSGFTLIDGGVEYNREKVAAGAGVGAVTGAGAGAGAGEVAGVETAKEPQV